MAVSPSEHQRSINAPLFPMQTGSERARGHSEGHERPNVHAMFPPARCAVELARPDPAALREDRGWGPGYPPASAARYAAVSSTFTRRPPETEFATLNPTGGQP